MNSELTQGTRLGNNELLIRIGRGGMATVWVARERAADSADDRLVAIKAMLANLAAEPEFVRMFVDEVRLVRAIRHPNVVDVYEVGEDQGIMYMSMEWVEGESLHTIIAEAGKRRPIPPEMAVRIIADAAAGLQAAHELKDDQGRLRGLVHRDVSPHNILLGTSGVVKLVDFGVAKAVGRLSEATRSGQLKGKFGYMSPEQARGKRVDRRADVFGLGIVLFELTTNRRLFRGQNDVDTLRLVLSAQVPRPSSIDPEYPRALEQIVMRALDRDLDRRYQTAADLQHDLENYLKEERIVVARSGVGGLLKRVMGERIELRRAAVRRAVKVLDGTLEPGAAADGTSDGVESGSGAGSGPSQVSFSPVSGSQYTGPTAIDGPLSGAGTPAAGSGRSQPAAPKGSRSETAVLSLLGLIALLLAILLIVLLSRS
jgi:serine/threonine-protein kinase